MISKSGRTVLSGAPEGYDARIIVDLVHSNRPVLHIARDDVRIERLRDALRFFNPELEIITVPAWDCLPYDRVSPSAALSGLRVSSLIGLARAKLDKTASPGRRVILTTVNSIVQRVPSPQSIAARHAAGAVGDHLASEELIATLNSLGYHRVDRVNDPGDYAIRGGIV
ncbi:MAG: transcription-repair coupling factor, partial [Pseudomonadota bacterium]